ncbi:ATP-grasp domain-containing protein [Microbispora sp. CA-102843]|uniref:ATP-grasp domain-containing protein n=1 Tax=Microbispora sp. CA-102843 TaxID=3239952 RepID=UPI003D94BFD5
MASLTFVCLETTEFFTRELARVAAVERDQLLLVTAGPPPLEGFPSLVTDARADPAGTAAAIRARCAEAPVAAVLTEREVFLETAAELTELLGVAGNPPEVVRAARDKARMKEIWSAAGVRTPAGRSFRSRAELAPETLTYPVVVKPARGFASCGVRRVDSPAELLEQTKKIALINATLVARESDQDAGLLVEECLDGEEYSVDTVWFDGEPVCEFLLSRGHPGLLAGPYYPDRLYLLQQSLPEERRREVSALARDAVRALGIRSGASHTEVRLRGGVPYVLESSARPGAGGVFYELVRRAHEVDFTRALYLSLVCSDRAELDARLGLVRWRQVPEGASYFWYNLPYRGAGLIEEIAGAEELERREDVLFCVWHKRPGGYLHAYNDLNPDYFCTVVGRHTAAQGGPPLEELVASYDRLIDVGYR